MAFLLLKKGSVMSNIEITGKTSEPIHQIDMAVLQDSFNALFYQRD
jgi:hypothetical protein